MLRSRWPARWMDTGHFALVGFLLHAGYLGGVFYAIELGMPTGIAALIVGLQPILTAILTALVGITIGTVYQKRFCADIDLISGTTIQYLSAATVLGLGSLLFETREI